VIFGLGFLALVTIRIRYSARFGMNRGPMPQTAYNVLLWVTVLSGLAFMAWEMHLGNTDVLP
jgi:hypothetical protein